MNSICPIYFPLLLSFFWIESISTRGLLVISLRPFGCVLLGTLFSVMVKFCLLSVIVLTRGYMSITHSLRGNPVLLVPLLWRGLAFHPSPPPHFISSSAIEGNWLGAKWFAICALEQRSFAFSLLSPQTKASH